jgi:hypothetical protein
MPAAVTAAAATAFDRRAAATQTASSAAADRRYGGVGERGGSAVDDETVEDDSAVTPSLLEMFAATDAGVELESEVQDAFRAFGHAMVCGQLLEWATGLAAPSVTAPLDDDDAAVAAVAKGIKRPFIAAIDEFEAAVAAAGEVALPPDLVERLHAARRARNALAHRWVWDGAMRAFAGEAQAVIAELEELAAEFMGLVGELFEAVFVAAFAARGVDPALVAEARDAITAAVIARPELADGLTLPEDTEVLLMRIAAALDDENQQG